MPTKLLTSFSSHTTGSRFFKQPRKKLPHRFCDSLRQKHGERERQPRHRRSHRLSGESARDGARITSGDVRTTGGAEAFDET